MYGLIMFLLYVPVIGVVLVIIGIMIALCSKREDKAAGEEIPVYPDVPSVMPEQKSSVDYPDLADQLDSRLTNVFRNPWKGIL